MHIILAIYLKSLLISAVIIGIISGLYILGTISRNYNQPKYIRQNKLFDIILIDILTIPVFSFAVLAVIVVLMAR